jgi:Cellulose biosynthesis protein BcsS
MDQAIAAGPSTPSFLLFAGTDISRYGLFLNGGLVWSPAGIDADGFTFKALLNGGNYTYFSDGLHANVDGTLLAAAAMPGWRFTHDNVTVSLFAGPTVQDYRLSPYDPGSRLHRLYAGGEFAADIWYQPTAATMAALSGAIASIGPTGSLRAAFGIRLFDQVFVGPEVQGIWCGNYDEARFGAQVTALHIGTVDWSAAGGWSLTSDQRQGPYVRFGAAARY